MKTHFPIRIAGLLIALIFLFAALPPQAQANSVNNLQFAVDGGQWQLSWSSSSVPHRIVMQFKGGDITNVWTSISGASISFSAANTEAVKIYMSFDPLTNSPAGKTFKFRVRTKRKAGNFTSWKYVSHTFN